MMDSYEIGADHLIILASFNIRFFYSESFISCNSRHVNFRGRVFLEKLKSKKKKDILWLEKDLI